MFWLSFLKMGTNPGPSMFLIIVSPYCASTCRNLVKSRETSMLGTCKSLIGLEWLSSGPRQHVYKEKPVKLWAFCLRHELKLLPLLWGFVIEVYRGNPAHAGIFEEVMLEPF
jgi:hypothetical protein